MSSYQALAKFYERFTDKDCDYDCWSQYLFGQLVGDKFQKGVDLACGTGKMTRLLAKGGLDVIGMDASAEMLAEAVSRGGKCRYVRGDLKNFALPRPVSFLTVVNDGVNYLSQGELAEFFRRASDNLISGGKLIFDLSSPFKLREVVGNNVFYYDDEDVTCLWCNKLCQDSVAMELTIFEKDGETYRRFDERHVQYIHETEVVLKLLDEAGFETETCDCYDQSKAVCSTTQRTTFAATKK